MPEHQSDAVELVGTLVWNISEKTYRGGTKVRIARDPSEWIRTDAPELRIVDDELWFAAHAQMRTVVRSATGAKKLGRPPRHLLSGLAKCGERGGPLTVTNGKSSYETVEVYACSYSRDRGKTVCSNTPRRPVEAVNGAVIDWIKSNILPEELIVEVLKRLRHRLAERAKTTTTDIPQLEKQATRIKAEIDRLVLALASSDQRPEAIVSAIAERQEQLAILDARIRTSKAAPEAINFESHRMEVEAKRRIADVREMLDRNPQEARKVLGTLFARPITVSPIAAEDGKRFWVAGSAVVGRILTAESGCLNTASPAGFEPA